MLTGQLVMSWKIKCAESGVKRKTLLEPENAVAVVIVSHEETTGISIDLAMRCSSEFDCIGCCGVMFQHTRSIPGILREAARAPAPAPEEEHLELHRETVLQSYTSDK